MGNKMVSLLVQTRKQQPDLSKMLKHDKLQSMNTKEVYTYIKYTLIKYAK